MSADKRKYWEVTTTKIVRANNKQDAISAARNVRRVPNAELLGTVATAERISAPEARQVAAQLS